MDLNVRLLCVLVVTLAGWSVCEGSVKKGVAVSPKTFLCDDFSALTNISWWYDWRMNFWYYHHFTNCSDIDSHKWNHVPMVWGYDPKHSIGLPHDALAVLGYNEPNFHSQSNMTAREAAEHWRDIERHSHGRPLVSPAAAPCSTVTKCYGNSFDWFDEFFRYCNACRVDYLATHSYVCHADTLMSYLTKLHQQYGRKIWLTEFACPHTTDANRQLEYMKEVLPRLEAADFVYRYSWYKARITSSGFITTSASLLQPSSSTLTPLGQFYNSYQGQGHGSSVIIG